MRKNTYPLLIAIGLLCLGLLNSAPAAAEEPAWAYYEENYEIYSPRFSADNSELTFVRMRHLPDGHEAEMFSDEELNKLLEPIETNPRFADPEVVLMRLSDKKARFVDYGWDPAFSEDKSKLYYSRQVTPISGKRTLAATLAGNEICEYDIASQKSTVLATPSSGFLSDPRPVANGKIIFALSDATNGAWQGDVGVGSFDPKTKKQETLYKPTKEHDLFQLVKRFDMQGEQCLVLRLRPLTAGTYMADSYAHELVDAASGKVLYNWGEHPLGNMPPTAFKVCPSGLELYTDSWQFLPAKKSASTESPGPGLPSPDCAHVAFAQEQELIVLSSDGRARHWSPRKGLIMSLTWSPDSSRLAVVISHGINFDEKFEYDEVIILPLSDKAPGQ